MENSIYNAMIAANKILEKQTTIANNLANISTTGFKEQFNYFLNNDAKNLDNKFNYIQKYYNFSPGTMNYTNRNLDLFVKENGWLCVKDLNGQEAYTKNGHLKINSQNKLTIQENEVLGNNGSIKIPKDVDIKILSNGKIVAINKNKKTNFQQVIGNLKLVNLPPNHIIQKENGLFYFKKTNEILNKYSNFLNHDENLRIQPGLLEASNVNTAKNMIEMISNARQFETQMKIISMCDKNAEYANQLININN